MPVIPTLQRLRQEGSSDGGQLEYILNLRPSWNTQRGLVWKNQTNIYKLNKTTLAYNINLLFLSLDSFPAQNMYSTVHKINFPGPYTLDFTKVRLLASFKTIQF
jgi:hypothetical protein